MPRKASSRKAGARKNESKTSAKSTDKTTDQTSATRGSHSFTDRNTPADLSNIDPASPQGRRIKELQAQINEQAALAPAAVKPNYGESSMTLGGVKKILREAGDENTGKPSPSHIVQQGGGGAVDGNSGQPVR